MKKIVHYKPSIDDYIEVGMNAYVYPIDHPGEFVSNTKLARTTSVLRHDKETGEFETKNTIYRVSDDE